MFCWQISIWTPVIQAFKTEVAFIRIVNGKNGVQKLPYCLQQRNHMHHIFLSVTVSDPIRCHPMTTTRASLTEVRNRKGAEIVLNDCRKKNEQNRQASVHALWQDLFLFCPIICECKRNTTYALETTKCYIVLCLLSWFWVQWELLSFAKIDCVSLAHAQPYLQFKLSLPTYLSSGQKPSEGHNIRGGQ